MGLRRGASCCLGCFADAERATWRTAALFYSTCRPSSPNTLSLSPFTCSPSRRPPTRRPPSTRACCCRCAPRAHATCGRRSSSQASSSAPPSRCCTRRPPCCASRVCGRAGGAGERLCFKALVEPAFCNERLLLACRPPLHRLLTCILYSIHSPAEMPYSGTNSFFLRVLLDKKYALPYRVVDALVSRVVLVVVSCAAVGCCSWCCDGSSTRIELLLLPYRVVDALVRRSCCLGAQPCCACLACVAAGQCCVPAAAALELWVFSAHRHTAPSGHSTASHCLANPLSPPPSGGPLFALQDRGAPTARGLAADAAVLRAAVSAALDVEA